MESTIYKLENTPLVSGHTAVTRNATIASTGSDVTYPRGTVFGRVTATRKLKKWDPAAADGSETIVWIAGLSVTVPAAGDIKATGYIHGAFYRNALDFGAATAEQIDDAVWAMSANGMYVD
ncbi:head decoration protein [Halodesulfovibrio aestuarii]|uniref:Head decoration protein n=1 Tax=Halodesulfovibrio aestuarii TaxID=126333 RepID=A0ABV4JWQ3_9BACT